MSIHYLPLTVTLDISDILKRDDDYLCRLFPGKTAEEIRHILNRMLDNGITTVSN